MKKIRDIVPGDLVQCTRILYKEPAGPFASNRTAGVLSKLDVGLVVSVKNRYTNGVEVLIICAKTNITGWAYVRHADLIK